VPTQKERRKLNIRDDEYILAKSENEFTRYRSLGEGKR
jgi:hypothetical protein